MKLKIKLDSILLVGLFIYMNGLLTFLSSYYSTIGRCCYAVGLAIIFMCSIKKLNYISTNKMIIWYALFFLIMLISTLYAVNPGRSQQMLFYVASFQLPAIIGVGFYCTSNDKMDKLMFAYILASIILALIVLHDGPMSIKNMRYGWSTTGEQPNTPALNLGAAFAFAFYFFVSKKEIKTKVFYGVLMALFVATILLTGSRKMVIYIVGIIALYSLYKSKNIKKTMLYISAFLFIILIGYLLLTKNDYLYNAIGYRIFTDQSTEYSSAERTVLKNEAIQYYLQSPIWGNGMNSYQEISSLGRYAHNNYLELLNGAGIFAITAYYGYFLVMLKRLWKQRQIEKNFLFFVILAMTLLIELYNVNYLQRGIYIIYTMVYCQYIFARKKSCEIEKESK